MIGEGRLMVVVLMSLIGELWSWKRGDGKWLNGVVCVLMVGEIGMNMLGREGREGFGGM